eukprot:6131891-Prymnesium_polylepis.2
MRQRQVSQDNIRDLWHGVLVHSIPPARLGRGARQDPPPRVPTARGGVAVKPSAVEEGALWSADSDESDAAGDEPPVRERLVCVEHVSDQARSGCLRMDRDAWRDHRTVQHLLRARLHSGRVAEHCAAHASSSSTIAAELCQAMQDRDRVAAQEGEASLALPRPRGSSVEHDERQRPGRASLHARCRGDQPLEPLGGCEQVAQQAARNVVPRQSRQLAELGGQLRPHLRVLGQPSRAVARVAEEPKRLPMRIVRETVQRAPKVASRTKAVQKGHLKRASSWWESGWRRSPIEVRRMEVARHVVGQGDRAPVLLKGPVAATEH